MSDASALPEQEPEQQQEQQEQQAPAPGTAELEAQLADMKDRLLRALAEGENIRKRSEKERQDTAKFAVASFARDLLSVADNLRRALAAAPEEKSPELQAILTGVAATERELLRVLEANGVRKIDSLGKPFDPNLHEVMFEVEAGDKAPGTVAQVVEEGYMLHDRLLRPARVGVAKGGEAPAGVDEQV